RRAVLLPPRGGGRLTIGVPAHLARAMRRRWGRAVVHTKHLRPFLAVVRQGNITRASEELRRVQSAVSRSIQELETAFGVALFERNARRWIVTPFGQILHARVENA